MITAVLLVIKFLLVRDTPYFWDAVSKATRANWIFENNFKTLIVPTQINAGHPPLWITLVAVFYWVFGKSLFSARLLLLLVNLGVFYQLFVLTKRVFAGTVPLWLFFLVCLGPTLVAQTTILNNDMLLLFFTLLGFNALSQNKQWLYFVALTGMLLTNLRGSYAVLSLGVVHFLYVRHQLLKPKKSIVLPYVGAAIVFGCFALWQYIELGWAIVTQQQNFNAHRQAAPLMRAVKNSVAFVRYYLEYGRIFMWLPLLWLLIVSVKTKKWGARHKKIFIPLVVFSVILFFGNVPFSNPMGPRYFLICYLLGTILFLQLLFSVPVSKKTKNVILGIVALGLVSGHFWIYPPTISQAWDSSLAYLRYFKAEEKMLCFIEKNNIPVTKTGTYL
ncbi:MAG: hypothetical protein ACPGQR_05755, partial [Marinirhabdus sp.]